MKIPEMIAVLLAAERGEPIQVRRRHPKPNAANPWENSQGPLWDFYLYDYRPAPKPREWWILTPTFEVFSDLENAGNNAKAIKELRPEREVTLVHVREVLSEEQPAKTTIPQCPHCDGAMEVLERPFYHCPKCDHYELASVPKPPEQR